jgi:hypothetical protein
VDVVDGVVAKDVPEGLEGLKGYVFVEQDPHQAARSRRA